MQHTTTSIQDKKLISHELREITELLIKHHDLHNGLYDLSLEFRINIGAVGAVGAVGQASSSPSVIPGITVGISRIGIINAEKVGPSTVDAAKVNPQKKISPTSKKTTAKK
ncbi:hypothetical protein [Ferrovum sp.]|uniref:hypothetical protein n=1 Tax=Ferrovum sp. TaxID=2609467 RepID=UPI0026240998|nr:hypothetical protein [Ferrovum sp.]